MKKQIVVTGGNGFIGATLVRRLLKNNYDIHVLIRKGANLWRLQEIIKQITIHEDILVKKNSLKKILSSISPFAIFHLATYGSYPFQSDVKRMIEINLMGTLYLLESLSEIPYSHCVVAGSSSEYGKKDHPMHESDILEPNNYYGALKTTQTHLCQVYAKTNHKPLTILRLFNVYGYYEEKGRLVRSVIESALKKEPIFLATGKEARDLIFVEDVADAFVTTLRRKPFEGEVFNIGTGIQSTIKKLAKLVLKLTKNEVPIKLGAYPGRTWDTTCWVADMKKTYSLLKWKPKYSLEHGLKKTIIWYKNYEKQASNNQ